MRKTNLIFLIPVIIFVTFFNGFHAFNTQEERQGISKSYDLPRHVLGFPKLSTAYRQRISSSSKDYEIWSQKKLIDWARSQGFAITEDTDSGGYQFRRAVMFKPPGIQFYLQVDTIGEQNQLGWLLFLDMGFFKEDTNKGIISTNFKRYNNILRYEIFVDHIYFKTVEVGYGKTQTSPLQLRLPFIRDRNGRVLVEIKLANHPNNFGILYDAFLAKELQ